MKFSVLLPTRSRLALLRYALESVRRQDFDDWEIVVSDNASIDGTAAYVLALNEPRIRLVHTDRFVTVTENWNNALANSAGDYVVMLGDDDCLLPGYFTRLSALLREFDSPDYVYVDAIQFAYPGVMPGHPDAFTQVGYSDLLRNLTSPAILQSNCIIAAVRKSMSFRLSFSYNMQHSLVSRRLIERLARHGPFFQSPYPDYYASNAALLVADRVLAVPEELVAIGISPKSFGFYYFNARIDEGVALLNNSPDEDAPEVVRRAILPGNPLFTSWYLAMAQIERSFGREYGVRVDTRRYRLLQILDGNLGSPIRTIRASWPRLGWMERLLALFVASLEVLTGPLPAGTGRRLVHRLIRWESPFPRFDPQIKTVEHQTIMDLFEAELIKGCHATIWTDLNGRSQEVESSSAGTTFR